MQELIQTIAAKAGITEQQAAAAVNATKDYIKAKVPLAAGVIDQFFASSAGPAAAMKAASDTQSDWMDKAKDAAQDAGEKVQEFTQDAIDKGSDFAKEANRQMHEWAEKAGGWSEDAMNRIKDMFGKEKGESNPDSKK